MKALQQSSPEPLEQKRHCCFVAYRSHLQFCVTLFSAVLVTGLSLSALFADDLEDKAQVYVDEYHEPDPSLILSQKGKDKSQALARYSRGRKLENQGQTEAAIGSYLKVLELQPDAYILARKTAHLMARSGQQKGGLELLERTLEKNPDEALAHIALSEYLATYYPGNKAKQDRAIEIIEAALVQFPDEPAVYERIVELYLVANRKDDAKAVVDAAHKRDNSDPRYWLRLGILAGRVLPLPIDAKNNEPVVLNSIFKKALDHAGNDAAVKEKVGDFYRTTKQYEMAEAVYAGLIKEHPDDLELRKKLAVTYAGMQKEDKLIETLKGILEVDPTNTQTHRQIAQIYIKKGDNALAIPHLKAVLRINKEGAKAHLALAAMIIRTDEGRPIDPKAAKDAVKFLDHAAYLFPEAPELPDFAARILRATKQWKEAVKKTELVLKLAKKEKPELLDEYFYFGFAAAVERSGDIPRAEKLFRKTIELINKNQPEEDPEKSYQKFIAQTYNYLGYMWLENDMNIDEAGEMIKTAIDLDPDSGAIVDSIGWFHFKKGRYADAKKELLRAEKMTDEPDGVIYDHIGRALFHNGDKAEAVEYMERAVAMEPEKKEFADRLKKYKDDLKKALKKAPKKPAEVQ